MTTETIVALARVVNGRYGKFSQGFEWRAVVGAHEQMRLVVQPNGDYAVKSPDGTEWLSIQPNGSWEYRPDVPGQPGPYEMFYRDPDHPKRLVSRNNPSQDFMVLGDFPINDDSGGGGGDVIPISRLHVDRTNFKNESGQIVKVHGLTAFTMLDDLLNGRNRGDYVRFAQSLGVNWMRVFGDWGLTGFSPRDYSDYYNQLGLLATMLGDSGMYLHFVCFASRPGDATWMSTSEQDAHVRRVQDVAAMTDNLLVEIQNEPYNNGELAARFSRSQFPNSLTARGAAEDGTDPRGSGDLLQWTTQHTPRDGEWERKAKNMLETARLGGDGWQATGQPAIGGEPRRLAEGTNDRQWGDYYALADLFSAGAVIHGGNPSAGHESGLQFCQVPTGTALRQCQVVAEAWSQGGIPADAASDGEYSATHLGNAVCEEDGAIRSYAMIQGDRATLVRIRESEDAEPRLKNGWRFGPKASGPQEQIYHLIK